MAAIAFEVGKTYTLIGVDDFLGATTARTIQIVKISNSMFIYVDVRSERRGRHERMLVLNKELVFEGSEVPFMTDFDAHQNAEADYFQANANYNLIGTEPIEEVRRFIESKNLNQEINFGKVFYKEVPVFAELAGDWMQKQLSHGL